MFFNTKSVKQIKQKQNSKQTIGNFLKLIDSVVKPVILHARES